MSTETTESNHPQSNHSSLNATNGNAATVPATNTNVSSHQPHSPLSQSSTQSSIGAPQTASKPIKIINNDKSTASNSDSSTDSAEHILINRDTLRKANVPKTNNATPVALDDDFTYESIDQSVKSKYTYHDEPHSFENSMEFLEDYKNFQFEVLETTV